MSTCSMMSERKRSEFEGIKFSCAELRTPNENSLRLAPEESSLSEASKVEFAFRNDVKDFMLNFIL